MKDIYYINSKGVKLNLLEPPYLLQTGELFDYTWNYESKTTSLGGGEITDFNKKIEERPLTLSIINYGKGSYYAAIDKFYETVEYDVLNATPGRLYFGEYYLECYITTSKKTEWETDSSLLDNELTIAVEYPFWTCDKKYSLYPETSGKHEEAEGLKYPFEYPYEYAGESNLKYLQNNHFIKSGFKMIIYGPVINPYVRIAGHLYEVYTTLYDGEYLTIDTRNKTVRKTKITGDVENLFNSRNKNSYMWEKIPPGRLTVTWPGTFGIDIILFCERGEPPWNL